MALNLGRGWHPFTVSICLPADKIPLPAGQSSCRSSVLYFHEVIYLIQFYVIHHMSANQLNQYTKPIQIPVLLPTLIKRYIKILSFVNIYLQSRFQRGRKNTCKSVKFWIYNMSIHHRGKVSKYFSVVNMIIGLVPLQ